MYLSYNYCASSAVCPVKGRRENIGPNSESGFSFCGFSQNLIALGK